MSFPRRIPYVVFRLMLRGVRTSQLFQITLVILPVLVLASYGVMSLRRERQALEDDVRERSSTALAALAREIPREMLRSAHEYTEMDGIFHHRILRADAGSYLPNPYVQFSTNPDPDSSADIRRVTEWLNAESTVDLAAQPPARWSIPLDLPADSSWRTGIPVIPAWFLELSDQQRRAWNELEAAFAVGRIEETRSQISGIRSATHDDRQGRYCQFVEAVLQSRDPKVLLNLAVTGNQTITPTGLNLASLALIHALRADGGTNVDEHIWPVAARWVDRAPDLLAPRVLHELTTWSERDPARDQARLTAIRHIAQRRLLLTRALHEIASYGDLPPAPLTTISLEGGRYWVFTESVEESGSTHAPRLQGMLIPMDWLVGRLRQIRETTRALVPDYIGVTMEVAGMTIPLLGGDDPNPGHSTPVATERMLINSIGTRTGSAGSLSAFVIDSDRMFQRLNQRVTMIGGVIVLVLIAAMVGLWQIFANLRRQSALNELKTNFVSSVSHELRAPIASVRLMAENLESGKVSGPDKLNEYVRFIGQECRRLSALIENVLDFSRIDQGRKQYEPEPTNLTQLLEDTVRLMQPHAEERKVELTFNPEGRVSSRPDDVQVRAENSNGNEIIADPGKQVATTSVELSIDGGAIQQALINLMDNAIKHSAPDQTVTVSLKVDDKVRILVMDQGPGIPVDEQSKIFDRFYRRGSELRRDTQGIGIGLSIVKHVVDAHAGTIRVESEPGKGTTFTIELNRSANRE